MVQQAKKNEDIMIRITPKARKHLQKVVDVLNKEGYPTTLKGYVSSLILGVEIPLPKEVKSIMSRKESEQ